MPVGAVFEYCQSLDNLLVLEYFYHGEKLDNPILFFDEHPGLFEMEFPSHEETQHMINKKPSVWRYTQACRFRVWIQLVVPINR